MVVWGRGTGNSFDLWTDQRSVVGALTSRQRRRLPPRRVYENSGITVRNQSQRVYENLRNPQERLQRFGEGSVNIIFGVADLDQGMKRVLDNGGTLGHEARLNGDEPFLAKFSRFREVRVNAFDDAFGCVFGLSEIVPMNGD
jgi:hypothetical protein